MAVRWLLATVGRQDPETAAGPTGPLRTALEVRPERVVLIHSGTPGFPERAEETERRLREEVPAVAVQRHTLRPGDVSDFVPVLDDLQRLVVDLPVADGDEVHVCATSGTPAMTVALTLAASARFPAARHWYAANPAETAGPPLRRFDPDALRHHQELVAACRALADCRAGDARQWFQRRLAGDTDILARVRPAVEAGYRLAMALGYVQDFQLDLAAKALDASNLRRQLLRRCPGLGEIGGWFRALAAGRRDNAEWPVELAAVALRERQAARTSLAVVRLALAHEVALQVRLLKQHGVDADRVTAPMRAKLVAAMGEQAAYRALQLPAATVSAPERTRERAADGGVPGRDGGQPPRIEGSANRLDVLEALEPALSASMTPARRAARKRIVDMRNDLVHRGAAGAGAEVDAVLDGGIDYLQHLYARFGWRDPQAAPSAPAALARLAGELASALGVGLGG